MPRDRITPSVSIESLAILDEDVNVDTALEPTIDSQALLDLYSTMILSRRFDKRLLDLQRQGRTGTFPPITGQEAAQLGAVALRPKDCLIPSFRETAAGLWRGRSLENILIVNNGLNAGGIVTNDARDFPISIRAASQIPHAVEVAWTAKYRGANDVVMVFMGDGATSEGYFHEAMNFATVFQSPVIFVYKNNQWAISMPISSQTRAKTLAQKATAYETPGIRVDGDDILAVFATSAEAVERARSGHGPTFIECFTYRWMMHTTADDPKRYRSEKEVEIWSQKDPLSLFEIYLRDKGLLDEQNISEVQTQIDEKTNDAFIRAEEQMRSMGDPLEMFGHSLRCAGDSSRDLHRSTDCLVWVERIRGPKRKSAGKDSLFPLEGMPKQCWPSKWVRW